VREAFVSQPRPGALRAINYRPEVEAFRSRRSGRVKSLGAMVAELGESYGQVFTRLDCAPPHGVELIAQSDMFAIETHGRRIRIDSMPRPEKHRVKRWQVLLASAGQMEAGNLFGRSILADARLVDKYIGPDAIALTFHDEGGAENLWTYAFLNTRVGLAAVRTCAYGTSVPRIRRDLLAQLPIPVADEATVSRVVSLIRETLVQRERYAVNLSAVRRYIETLPEMHEAHAMCAERRARCTKWSGDLPTLSAWNFASTGDALAYLLEKWSGRLADVVPPSGLFRGNRLARIPCTAPHGVDLVSQRDIFLIRPIPQRVLLPNAERGRMSAPAGTLLAGGQGTLGEGEIFGRVALVTRALVSCI
jgi:hypothetical protein